DFIYFSGPRGAAAVRVYANAKPEHVPAVITRLLRYVQTTPNHGILDFKVAGPAVIRSRKDTIVGYCATRPAAEALAKLLAGERSHFNASFPALTTPIEGGVGISLGAEPKWEGTGMSEPKFEKKGVEKAQEIRYAKRMNRAPDLRRHDAESYNAQSFGSMRSE